MKPQTVRLADVFIIGPLMVWGGLQLRDKHPQKGTALAWLGVATGVYNLSNYAKRQRQLRAGKKKPPTASTR